ncbi:secretin N-terminal domain-containing protein [Deinococcus sp. VB142]|uniref:Secretin N-terminal domain-containing protein n=1 Tax=Deinococcus sp. VB142 TaxID=3112952 RepID=A0AAU6Q452_9DEIO
MDRVPEVQRIYTVRGQVADITTLLGMQFPNLRVTSVGQTGQLVLNGTQAQIDTALALLGQVDRPAVASNAVQQVYTVRSDQGAIVTFLRAQYPELQVTPVGTTGQLLLSGTRLQLDAALGLLGQVDRVSQGPQTVQKVFQLVNASAEEVKATLEGTLARDLTNAAATEPLPNVPVTATDANGNTTVVSVPNAMAQVANQGTAAQGQSTQTAAAASTQQATLIADKRTNTLIVRGTTEQVAQIAELIPQLDQVVPQVNVQVRIQEITKEASNSLGLNWRASFGGFNVAVGSDGFQGTFNPTQSFVGFNIFPTLRTLESQNLTRTVYDGNVTMQSGQRSLTSTGGAQNASSSAAASIKSGGRLELNIPSPAGNIVRQIDYGLNLDFFDPQVAPDGSITLRVRGQVNNLKTAVAAGAALPNNLDFANSEAQSTITFKSGQTVLMSGLLSTNNTDTRSGVPFLSSLPVVGGAFGEQTKRKRETQLLIIVTGTIVK